MVFGLINRSNVRNQWSPLCVVALIVLLTSGFRAYPLLGIDASRNLASMALPNVDSSNDADDIVQNYEVYFQFIVDAGKRIDRRRTEQMVQAYQKLRKTDLNGAARFLKGLRYELIHKLNLTGTSHSRFNTHSRYVQKWVKRFLPEWSREIDEQYYRSYARYVARKNNE